MKKHLYRFIIAILFISLLSCSVYASDIIITPADNTVIYDIPGFIETNNTDYEKVIIELDGKPVGECDGEGRFTPDAEIPYGAHKISAIGIKNDGSVDKDTHNFLYKKREVLSEHSFRDFDDFDGSNIEEMGFEFSSTIHELKAVEGKSGSDGDKALEMVINSDGKFVGGSHSIKSTEFIDYTSGISEVEFDMKYKNVGDNLSIIGMKLWTGNTMVIESKKWKKTGVNVSTEWMHIKIISYADEGKISFYVDGVPLVEKADYSTNSTSINNKSFGFCPWQGSVRTSSNLVRAGIIIDNFSAINYKEYTVVEGIDFICSDGVSSDAANVSPSVSSIKLALGEELGNINSETVYVCTDEGRKIKSNIDYNPSAKEIIITPKAIITAETNMLIVFDKAVLHSDGEELGKNFVLPFKTTNNKLQSEYSFKNGVNSLYTMKQVSGGDITADINVSLKAGTPSFNGIYVMTLQKDGEILAITADDVSLNEENQSTTVSLSLPACEGAELYLMLCDTFRGGVAQNKRIKIE